VDRGVFFDDSFVAPDAVNRFLSTRSTDNQRYFFGRAGDPWLSLVVSSRAYASMPPYSQGGVSWVANPAAPVDDEAPWLLPTQNVTGVVELSTNTLRMFVDLAEDTRELAALGSSRAMRSLSIDPSRLRRFCLWKHRGVRPRRCMATPEIFASLVSKTAICCRDTHRPAGLWSIMPRRGPNSGGRLEHRDLAVFASILPICSWPMSVK